MMLEAVKVALDPTPVQERLMLSHAGAARFAYNAGLAHVKETIETGGKLEWTLYALRRWWNANKGTLAVDADGTPWWRENSKEAYNSGLEACLAVSTADVSGPQVNTSTSMLFPNVCNCSIAAGRTTSHATNKTRRANLFLQ